MSMRRTVSHATNHDFQNRLQNHEIFLQKAEDSNVQMKIENIAMINNLNELLDNFQESSGQSKDLKLTHIVTVQKGEITLIVGEIEDIDCMRESKVENNLS